MARSTLEVIIQLTKKGGGDKDTIRGLNDVKRAWSTVLGVVGGVTAAYAIVDKVFIQNANRAADYALKIDDLSRVTGIQVDQMSRLVQAADDVRISQETLTTGLEFAVRQGFKPSIEWLGQMADRIQQMPPGAQRAEEAIRLFGKASGPDMLRLLELGEDGIAEYMAAIDGSLVVTDSGVERAREYKAAVDELNDAWTGFTTGVGMGSIPVLTTLAKGLQGNVLLVNALTASVSERKQAWLEFLVLLREIQGRDPILPTRNLTDWATHMYEAQQAGYVLGTTVQDTSQQMQDFGSIARQSVEDVSVSMYQLALAQDGVFDEADMQRLLDYQVALGTMTELERAAAEQALAVNQYLSTLPADIPINIRITITKAMGYGATSQEAQWLASNPALQGVPGLAEGGPLGMANIVGERGWEAIVERPDGEHVVIPHDVSRFLMEQGLLPVSGVFGGGGPIGGGIVKRGSKRMLVSSLVKGGSVSTKGWSSEGSTSTWKPESTDPSSPSGSTDAVSAASAAVQAVAPVIQGTMDTFTASQQQNSAQVSQQTQTIERTNQDLLNEQRATRRAVEALAEQLAAEIKKG